MRYAVNRSRASGTLALIAIAASTLSACNRLKPAGESEAMTLLQSGSDKVCTASDVQSALRTALLPKPTDLPGGDDNAKRKALEAVTFSYSNTALASFDKPSNTATCNGTVEVHGPFDHASSFNISYAVSPANGQTGSFAVAVKGKDALLYVLNTVGAALPGTTTISNAASSTDTRKSNSVGPSAPAQANDSDQRDYAAKITAISCILQAHQRSAGSYTVQDELFVWSASNPTRVDVYIPLSMAQAGSMTSHDTLALTVMNATQHRGERFDAPLIRSGADDDPTTLHGRMDAKLMNALDWGETVRIEWNDDAGPAFLDLTGSQLPLQQFFGCIQSKAAG